MRNNNVTPIFGLCATCIQAKEMRNDRSSAFLLCLLSKHDPRYPKYPRLPMLRCDGYREKPGAGGAIAHGSAGEA